MHFGQRLLLAAVAVLCTGTLTAQVQDSSSTWNMPGLSTPSNIHTEVTYDPITGFYVAQKYIGTVPLGGPMYYTPAAYRQLVFGQQEAQGWQNRWSQGSASDQREGASIVPEL